MAQAAKNLQKVEAPEDRPQLELIPTSSHNPFWQSSLFNEIYLQNDVPVKYKELWETDEAGPFYDFCNAFRNLCEELKDSDFSSWSERNTINRIIKPVLRMLGYTDKCSPNQEPWAEDEPFSVKEGGELKTYKPDFIIVNDPKELKYIERKKGEEKLEEARNTVILPIEAKYWDRIEDHRKSSGEDSGRADKKDQGDATRSLDFDEQCLKYMEILNKDYGILTDGKTWRLYNRELSSDSYRRNFQFSLGHLIKHVAAGLDKDPRDYDVFVENAKYFFHLFSKQALYSENGERRFVDDLLEYSKKYVTKVEEDLKARFVKAMAHACNGFLRSVDESKEKAELATIRNVAESQLFNILFIKHCESRNILPLKQSPEYRKISISNTIDKLEYFDPEREEDNLNFPALKRMFSKDFNYDAKGTELYDRLLKLTRIVQEGTKAEFGGFEVKGFKESIFSKEEWSFVRTHKLINSEMVRVLFELGYCESDIPGKKYQQIPYNFFSPRQLGSIYESFLEFRLERATEDMAFIKKQWSPANLKSEKVRALDVPKVRRGQLFFTPDNNDRKVTGSYYTPDAIVQLITRETLFPLVKGKSSRAILELRICDPAMGSGHFLSAALNYLSRAYLQALESEVNDDLTTSVSEAKKTILHNCIFGVDINLRAVKLAKMSLWLESANADEKLEPLDDQLKVGDALVSNLSGYALNFDWETEFRGISFSAIIGNPPWISILGKHKSNSFDDRYVEYLFSEYGLDTNRPNIYEAFVRKSLNLVGKLPGARYGVIVPDRLGMNEQFVDLRTHILKTYTLEKVFYGYPFPGVIVDTGIFVIANLPSKTSQYYGARFPNELEVIPFAEVLKDKLVTFTVNSSKKFEKLFKSGDVRELVNGGVSSSFVGFIAGKGNLKDDKEAGLSKALKGRDIQPFKIVGCHYVKLEKSSFIGGTQDLKKLTAKPKILIRKTGDRIIAALEEDGIAIEQSLYALYNFQAIDPRALVCYLNSSLATEYYMDQLVTNKSSTPQLKKIHLDQFPIPMEILKENEAILNKLYEKAVKNEDNSDVIEAIDRVFRAQMGAPKKCAKKAA